jgi:Leucine-rich repeat (LRR) protein
MLVPIRPADSFLFVQSAHRFGCERKSSLKYCLCNHNQLTDIDMSANPVLQILSCAYNQLTILDVSANPELQDLSCSYNQLTGLDVSANPAYGIFLVLIIS